MGPRTNGKLYMAYIKFLRSKRQYRLSSNQYGQGRDARRRKLLDQSVISTYQVVEGWGGGSSLYLV